MRVCARPVSSFSRDSPELVPRFFFVFILDTESINATQFQEMVLHVMYEMEFLPAIEVEKIDSFTGFVTPKGGKGVWL